MKSNNPFFRKFHVPAVLSEIDSGKVIAVNEQCQKLFKRENNDFFNLKRTDLFTQKAIKELNKHLKTNTNNFTVKSFIVDKEGLKNEVEIHSELITDDNNNYLIDFLSVPENKPEQVEKSTPPELKYKTLFQSAGDALLIVKDEKIIEVNLQALKIFNTTEENLLGKLLSDIITDGSGNHLNVTEGYIKTLNGETQSFETNVKRAGGSSFNAEVNLVLINLQNENLIEVSVRDITEKKAAENEIIKKRKSLYSLLKNLPGVTYRCKNDNNWTMEFISEGCLALTGYSYKQLLNNNEISYAGIILEEDRERIKNEIQKALSEKIPFRIIYRIKTADNKIKWVWEQGNGIFSDETGELICIEGSINDITQQKIVEDELKHSETQFRSLVEESLVGVYVIQDGKFPYVNPRLAEIFGYKPDDIIMKMSVDDFVADTDREKVQGNIMKRLKGEVKTLHYSFKGVKKDKSVIDVEVMGSKTIFNSKPALIGTIIDITEKNRSEKEIKKLSSAVEQSPASIVITDTEGRIEYVNSKFTRVTGYTFDEVKGKNPRILKYGDTPKSYYEDLWNKIKSGKEWFGEFLNKKKNGELFWEYSLISPVKDNNGNIINFLAIKEDITERKNIQEELKIAKEKAEEMNKLKTVFLANMSHELRTPMVAVLGYSEILKNEIANPELRDLAREIYDSSYRFLKTLNLILDLSKIESNKEIINLAELDVTAVAKEEFYFYKQMAERKHLEIKTSLPDQPAVTLLDERMLRQVINCITNNAVKFTSAGSVSLDIFKEPGKSGGEEVVIKISDTGIGIPKNNLNIIFDPFRQLSEGLNRSFEGAGLGLTVAKKFVEMMNGNIEVESEFGKGSAFIIKFPLLRRSEIQPVTLKAGEVGNNLSEEAVEKQPSLLLVEDDQSNAGVIKFFLESSYTIDSVLKGEEAVEKASQKKYTAVLMDIDLGTGMSGIEAAKKIKKISGYENTPIIAVTALAMRGDKEKFLNEGCTHYISKPFKKEDLTKIIKEAITKI